MVLRLHTLDGNKLALMGIGLVLVPIIAWVLILRKQFTISNSKTYRINVLTARTCLFLPLYAIYLWISVLDPYMNDALEPFYAVVEGYSFYCMFALLVTNLGGPRATILTLRRYPDRHTFCPCYPWDGHALYSAVLSALRYMFLFRVVLVILATVLVYLDLRTLYLAVTGVSLCVLIYGVVSLINFYEVLMHLDLGHVFKMVTLKVSVGLIVIQGLVEEILFTVGVFDHVKPHPHYTQAGTVLRYYCFLVLLEYLLFSVAVWYIYTREVKFLGFTPWLPNSQQLQLRPDSKSEHAITAGIFGPTGYASTSDAGQLGGEGGEGGSGDRYSQSNYNSNKKSFGTFFYDVLSFTDLWGEYSLRMPVRFGLGGSGKVGDTSSLTAYNPLISDEDLEGVVVNN